jgi:hypothetical protein
MVVYDENYTKQINTLRGKCSFSDVKRGGKPLSFQGPLIFKIIFAKNEVKVSIIPRCATPYLDT